MTIAQAICYIIAVQILALVGIDIWLAHTGRELITTAARDFNSETGWIVAGAVFLLVFHLFCLPYVISLYHWVLSIKAW